MLKGEAVNPGFVDGATGRKHIPHCIMLFIIVFLDLVGEDEKKNGKTE